MGHVPARAIAALLLILIAGIFALPANAKDAAPPSPAELRIVRITPDGDNVDAARQIVIEFNRPVVPLGNMARRDEELGITITPAVDCQWRWLNTSALACNLPEKSPLARATAYKMRIEPRIAAQDGAMIAAAQDHSFTTLRPATGNVSIRTWKSPGRPELYVDFNMPVTKDSVEKSLYLSTPDGTRHPLAATMDKAEDEEILEIGGTAYHPRWILLPVNELPLNEKITLGLAPGLLGADGAETSLDTPEIRSFFTFPEFTFRGVVCSSLEGKETFLTPGSPQTKDSLCDPMRPVTLSFSAPVMRSTLKDALIAAPSFGKAGTDAWGSDTGWSRLSDQRYDQAADYRVMLPMGLKAASEYTLSVPERPLTLWQKIKAFFTGETPPPATLLTDEFGRILPPFSLTFSTGHRNPNFELGYNHAMLEKNVDSEVPLYVNNLKSFSFEYDRLTSGGASSGKTDLVTLPAVQDIQYAVPAGLRSILDGKSGAVYARLSTDPAVRNKADGAGRIFAQVTPYQVYVKLGHFNSLAWVTDLATGEPVPDARLTVFTGRLTALKSGGESLATAETDENGLAILPGTDTLDPDLVLAPWRDDDERLFLRVDKGADMALLPFGYDYEVQLWNVSQDVYGYGRTVFSHMKAWGMTAQGVYRAGDTMQYKIFVRNQDENRFIAPPSGEYTLDISDAAGKVVHTAVVTPNDFGSIAGEYAIPQTATVGWYNFKLTAKLKHDGGLVTREFYPLSVLVSDFTPAPFRVTAELNGDRFGPGDRLDIEANAALHSGGPFGDAAVRATLILKSRPFISKNPLAAGFRFDSHAEEQDTEDLDQKEETLNGQGAWKTSLTLPERPIVFGRLIAEAAVRDDRGKSIAAQAQADYVGVDRLVGLKQTAWVHTAGKPASLQALVVDDEGNPASGTRVEIRFEKEEVVTAKVKGAGNAYLADNTVEWRAIDTCEVTSGKEPVSCAFAPPSAGSYRAIASIRDRKGRSHQTTDYMWVGGEDYVQWNEKNSYALTIIPEKQEYKAGETARYLVKNPYPGAKALVTVERYGILDSFVQTLDGSTPVIEIPVKTDYIPGYYVSVVAFSPRVEAPPPETGQVDMGKPAFRVGYVKTSVPDDEKTILITAKPAQDVYRPRDTVSVTIEAKPAAPQSPAEPMELAVAVLDESVFDLIQDGRKAFDPYEGFYALDALDVTNYTILTRLMGRQKFEKKGANPGGDGGVDAGMRNIFKFVGYWNPSVTMDETGRATIEFEAPDNLTGWRILALAVTKDDRMGLGDASFKVNRPTEIRPSMPNQVREGDSFAAGFTVMNRTDTARTLKVVVTASGDIASSSASTYEESITLEPYKRKTVSMPLDIALLSPSRTIPEGAVRFSVTAGDETDSDGLEHTVPVLKSRTFETAASFGSTTEDKTSEKIAVPSGIHADGAEVGVVLSPSVIAGLDGAFKYMRDYSYPCWEQKLSMAVMAAQYTSLKPYLDDSTVWDGAKDLPADMISAAASYQAPGGGMAYFIGKDEYADPYLSAYTALAFGWLKDAGYSIPPSVEENLHAYLLSFLRNNTAPEWYDAGMTASVRAVILAALKDEGKIKADDILRFRKDLKMMDLFGRAHYLNAAASFPAARDAQREALNLILAAGVESAGKLSFNQSYDTGAWDRILATPVRDNCAALDALMSLPQGALGEDKATKLVRTVVHSRGGRDHWENTQENIFCMSALSRYARLYESESPRMDISATYNGKIFGRTEFSDVRAAPVTLTELLNEEDAGKTGDLSIERTGTGRLYYASRLRYALKETPDAVNAGIDVRREYSVRRGGEWVLAKGDVTLKRGDLVRVDLYVSVPTARSFVAVNDPLPGGLETVNRDLATASARDSGDDASDLYDSDNGSYWFAFDDWIGYGASRWSFYHRELRHDSARFYADWLEPGNYHLSYTAQAIATGTFAAPPVKAEEMYDPDIYGLGVKGAFTIEESSARQND